MTPREVVRQLNALIGNLIELGLSESQNHPSERRDPSGSLEISFNGAERVTAALKNQPYKTIYDQLVSAQAYSVKMPDGALIQMSYRFTGEGLTGHRLAFFPSPYLEDFQNEPEIYEADEVFADIVAKSVVPFPVRFDFDSDGQRFEELNHPMSHLTLGQFKNCRIPVSAPLTPFQFLNFVLRNFYNTVHRSYANEMLVCAGSFADTIVGTESEVVHIRVGGG
nr:DUF2290 domain-containing protein [Oceanococcus sp. HetDA_MAG_MS8]